jgi:RNA polymerase sigma-70 factor (ECF subfamily)
LAATVNDFEGEQPAVVPARPLDFEDIYARYFEFACRSLRLHGVPPEGLEDAAQDVFSVVSRRLPEFDGRASVTTWIFSIVQRVAANHRRTRRRKQQRLEPLGDEHFAVGTGPDAQAEALRTARLIEEHAASLDDERRMILVLGLFERVPPRELAESLGIPVFTVYSRIRAARDVLKAFLHEHEVDP